MLFSVIYLATVLYVVQGILRFVPEDKQNKTLQVRTTHGIVQGEERITVNGAKVFSYEGIPYAKPPLNNLRFRDPKPYKRWKDVLDGTRERMSCIEFRMRFTGIATSGVEDCLYLDVHTPQIPSSASEGLAVMVWIYGGGFFEGNSSSLVYGTDYLIDHGVIVVKFNYRLGMFGFLSTEDMASPGNYGLKDQRAVLVWVKENIKFFGGNPNKVTIFGESAGGCSVAEHFISKQSRGLFSAAIAMSGVAITPWCNKKNPGSLAADIGEALGIKRGNTTGLINVLRSLNTGRLRDLETRIMIAHIIRLYHEGLPFSPVIEPDHEGAFITEPTYDSIAKGDFAKVPLMIGRTSLEVKPMAIASPLDRFLAIYFDMSPSSIADVLTMPENLKSEVGKIITTRYCKSNSFTSATDEELIEFASDVFFNIPLDNTIKLVYKHIPVYSYVFKFTSNVATPAYEAFAGISPVKSIPGSGHGEEIPLLFKFKNIEITDPIDKLVSDRLVTLWTNFAKYRNPTPSADKLLQNVIWSKVESAEDIPYLEIGRELKVKRNFRMEYVKFWEQLSAKYNARL